MRELTKKVVILNNFSSPYISQAIIVLKDYNPKLESKVIEDAEAIVGKYIERTKKDGPSKGKVRPKSKLFKFIFGTICALAFAAALYFRLII